MSGLYNTKPTSQEILKMKNMQQRLLSEHNIPSKAPFNAYSNKVLHYNNNNIYQPQNQVFLEPQTTVQSITNNSINKYINNATARVKNNRSVSNTASRMSTPPIQNKIEIIALPGGWKKKQNSENTWYVSPNGISQWNPPSYNYNTAIKAWQGNIASGKVNLSKNTTRRRQTRRNVLASVKSNTTNTNINAKYKAMENKLPYFLSEAEWKSRTNIATKKMGYEKWRNLGIQRMKNASSKANKKRNAVSHRGPSGRKSRKNRT